MVGRAGFEPATNWLKAKASTSCISMFLYDISGLYSPHSCEFFYSFTFESIGFHVFCMAFAGNFFPATNLRGIRTLSYSLFRLAMTPNAL